jgi:hypothetical protein
MIKNFKNRLEVFEFGYSYEENGITEIKLRYLSSVEKYGLTGKNFIVVEQGFWGMVVMVEGQTTA